MLITALHFFIWIPVKDICNEGLNYIRRPSTQSWIRNQMNGNNNNNNNNNAPGQAPAPSSSSGNASQSAEGIFGTIVDAILTVCEFQAAFNQF